MIDIVNEVEKLYPETTAEFKRIQREQYELFCAKQLNYGPSNISLGSTSEDPRDIKLSITGIWFRINDKINRLKQLVLLNVNDAVNESVHDTFMDLSNYSIISIILLNKKWGK